MACSSLQLQLQLRVPLVGSQSGSRGSRTVSVLTGSGGGLPRRLSTSKVRAATDDLRLEIDENPEGIISGEWPENFSLLSYEDLRAYLEAQVIQEKMRPCTVVGELMSAPLRTATAEQTLGEIEHHFEVVSGLPVVNDQLRCVGVIAKTDTAKATHGLSTKVSEVMSSPAITLPYNKTVMDAAALMLKMKIHRVPITNEESRVIGIVTRTDIFQALETLAL